MNPLPEVGVAAKALAVVALASVVSPTTLVAAADSLWVRCDPVNIMWLERKNERKSKRQRKRTTTY